MSRCRCTPEAQQLEVSIDGERVQVFTLPGVGRTGAGAGSRNRATPPPGAADDAPAAAASAGAQRPSLPLHAGTGRGRSSATAPTRLGRARAGESWARDVQVAFLKNGSALDGDRAPAVSAPVPGVGMNVAEQRAGAYLRSVEISGPYEPSGPGTRRAAPAYLRLPPERRHDRG